MTKKSVVKLQDAGYEFLRLRTEEDKSGKTKRCIYQSKEFGTWKKIAEFATKKACLEHLCLLENLSNVLVESNYI
jgi:hypothetical protein